MAAERFARLVKPDKIRVQLAVRPRDNRGAF
jgi:hypothetical protein